ncbi:MAG TPA: D-alanine--D-alanine ligase, partial [Clostridiales bacterium]|nr:D-alanine--D-alanine ligase [Clostridiales bacterium]
MTIAILLDQPRKNHLPGEEGVREDLQKRKMAKEIENVLLKQYKCVTVIADSNFILKLQKEKVDIVFNLCNGIHGETRLAQIPAILEFFKIPYTGSSILGHTLSINKIISSRIFQSAGINTPKFLAIYDERDLEQLKPENIDFPVIIKPADEGSSRGVHQNSLVYDMESLKKKVKEELMLYNPPIMINEYIDGREFTVGILGYKDNVEILPILEISYDNLPDYIPKFSSFELKCHYNGYKSED